MRWILVVLTMLFTLAAEAEGPARLYATSIRTRFEGGATRVECNLYQVDPANGQSRILQRIQSGGQAVAIISLAIHPASGQIYGATDALSPAFPRSLVIVDPATGAATRVGALAQPFSDIGFANDGSLYGWLPDSSRLARIDPKTGAMTLLDASGLAGVMGGGMAIDDNDQGWVAATSATGTLDRLDIRTGHGAPGVPMQGAPFISAITNLTFSPDNRLYAVNSNLGSPATTMLVRIDTRTGHIESVGRLPDDSHALIFVPQASSGESFGAMSWAALAVVAAFAVAALVLFVRRRWRR